MSQVYLGVWIPYHFPITWNPNKNFYPCHSSLKLRRISLFFYLFLGVTTVHDSPLDSFSSSLGLDSTVPGSGFLAASLAAWLLQHRAGRGRPNKVHKIVELDLWVSNSSFIQVLECFWTPFAGSLGLHFWNEMLNKMHLQDLVIVWARLSR